MLIVDDISKSFAPESRVLDRVSIRVERGEIVCLLGPSGCGKTTLLRIVAGLEQADEGSVRLEGQDLVEIPVHRRNFGLMFQEYALFPHRTVGENIGFGLKMAGRPQDEIRLRVDEMLDLVDLHGYESRTIFELSGGERQRVALARSLAPSPRLLMLDEPLGSLDRALREELMNELRAILKRVGVTALYVTHDQQEAFAVADRLVLMHKGTVRQIGSATQIYWHPAEEFVARFLGLSNLLPAELNSQSPGVVETPIGRFAGIPEGMLEATGDGCHLLIRPQAASLEPGNGASCKLSATILACSFRGGFYRLTVSASAADREYTLQFDLPARHRASGPMSRLSETGSPITLFLDPGQLTLL